MLQTGPKAHASPVHRAYKNQSPPPACSEGLSQWKTTREGGSLNTAHSVWLLPSKSPSVNERQRKHVFILGQAPLNATLQPQPSPTQLLIDSFLRGRRHTPPEPGDPLKHNSPSIRVLGMKVAEVTQVAHAMVICRSKLAGHLDVYRANPSQIQAIWDTGC